MKFKFNRGRRGGGPSACNVYAILVNIPALHRADSNSEPGLCLIRSLPRQI